jgi:DNA-binding transcriptional LysR family regulator
VSSERSGPQSQSAARTLADAQTPLSLRHIHRLLAIVDAGDIGSASRATGVAPGALRESLQILESRLQVQIVERWGRAYRPTEAGRQIIEIARRLQAEVDTILSLAALSVAARPTRRAKPERVRAAR